MNITINPVKKILISTIMIFSLINCPGKTKDSSKKNLVIAAVALQMNRTTTSGSASISTLNVTGFNKPEAIGVTPSDSSLIVADTKNNQIKKIVNETTVTTLLDTNGVAGSPLVSPEGLCVDSSGNIFINNTDAHNIIRIPSGGTAANYAGLYNTSGMTNGTVSTTTAMLNGPEGIFCAANSILYIADVGNNQIRKIQTNVISNVAGSAAGTSGFINGNGTAALFSGPKGIASDTSGNIYVADNVNNAIRKISSTGDVTTLAGSTAGTAGTTDGTGTAARFNKPYALTIDESGNVYTTDSGNNTIRKITSSGVVTTLVGSSVAGSADGIGTVATLNDPRGIAYDSTKKVIYVTTAGDSKIRKIINF
jgi:sugar lactone lactonase YvrE